jgi:hypothetical protein
MEGFSFVTAVTGLNRPNTGKEDDDDCVSWTDRLSLNTVFILWTHGPKVLPRTEQRLHSGLLAERIRLAVMYEKDITALRHRVLWLFLHTSAVHTSHSSQYTALSTV